ncbi:MAG: hypothetical protein IIY81_07585 [Lachnospiraceae bacterium]|jgi:MFS family permease|nr:hypothetical protein [Lachnospiraceae bacterium]
MNKKQYVRQIVLLREKIYDYYIRYEKYVKYILRFIMAFALLFLLDKNFSYEKHLSGGLFLFVMAVLGAAVPDGVLVFALLMILAGKLYFLSPILAASVLFLSLLFYFVLLQYCDKFILLTVLVPLALICKVPALPAIVAGLFFAPSAVLAIIAGVLVYYMLYSILKCEKMIEAKINIMELVRHFLDEIVKNKNMYIILLTLSVAFFIVFFVSKIKIAYSFEISIGVAVLFSCILGIVGNTVFRSSFSIGWILVGNILSGILSYVIHFSHMILDYGSTQELQFEDEEYYYYVKAVPKLKSKK